MICAKMLTHGPKVSSKKKFISSWKLLVAVTILQFFIILFLTNALLNGSLNNKSSNDGTTKTGHSVSESGSLREKCLDKQEEDRNHTKHLSFSLQNGSSVSCYGITKRQRTCRFNNLCYHTMLDNYVFFHGPKTVITGLPKNRFDPALLDLSSVDDHNSKYFNFIDFPSNEIENIDLERVKYVFSPSILFHRFNPDNLMHVIHDDVLPLWMTAKMFLPRKHMSLMHLIMMDDRGEGEWFDLYKFISKSILLKDGLKKYNYTCFNEVIIGVSKETTWYQYGFKLPQGPITDHTMNSAHLALFANEVKSFFGCSQYEKQYVVLVARKHTRMILNQFEVSMKLANIFKTEVFFLDLEDYGFKNALCIVNAAVALVGMHGAELVLSLFLQSSAILIELFPYGISPENYTPYKTITQIVNVEYIAWQNMIPENSKGYPNRNPQQGGIAHLPKSLQDGILMSKEVPKHLCCKNPYWLYRIYQDTFVDVQSLAEKIGSYQPLTRKNHYLFYPDRVRYLVCKITFGSNNSIAINLNWSPPVNEKYFENVLRYQVIVQQDEDDNVVAYELPSTELSLENLKININYKVWVRSKFKEIFGPLSETVSCIE